MISTINSNVNRISGLASGLETEELVKQLTATTSGKIDAAGQQQQILEWKQSDYREILSKLVDFNEKYFGSSYTSTTINESLKTLTATSSDNAYVTAVAGSGAASGSIYISDIKSLATCAKLTSTNSVSPSLSFTADTDGLGDLAGKSMKVTLDGITKTITFSDTGYTDLADVADELTARLNEAFGSGRIAVSENDGKLTFSSENSTISISDSGLAGQEALSVLGFSDSDVSSNRLNLTAAISAYASLFGDAETFSFTINGEDFSFANTVSISKIISTINSSGAGVTVSYSNITDTFTISSKETGAGSQIELSDTQGSFLSGITRGGGIFTAGTNAEVRLSLNGSTNEEDMITLVRNSNTFSINGTSYTLKGMASGLEKEGVTVKVGQDTDSLMEKIKQFVSDYNDLLGAINDKLTEERDRDFSPLTDSQKEELSDSEQEKWTEKAKSGLLRNDMYLAEIARTLRSALYTAVRDPDGSGKDIGLIMADIGITTSDYTEGGRLKIDEDKLKNALNKNAEGVVALFTQDPSVGFSLYNTSENAKKRYEESGLLWRINDIIKTNISSVGKKGALIQLVGNPATGYVGETTYSKKIGDVKTTITRLKEKLAKEEDAYWSKFTAMETAINSLNAQSSWISSMMSS